MPRERIRILEQRAVAGVGVHQQGRACDRFSASQYELRAGILVTKALPDQRGM